MTPQQTMFVDEFLVDLNATQAAIRAGYSPRSARKIGYQLTQHRDVSDAIARAMAQRSRRTGISADRVLRELARIAFADIRDVVTWGPAGIQLVDSDLIDSDAAAAIAEVSETVTGRQRTKKVKLKDSMQALRMLAAHTGVDAVSGQDAQTTAERIRQMLVAMEASVGNAPATDTKVDTA